MYMCLRVCILQVGCTPLHVAVERADAWAVSTLLEYGADYTKQYVSVSVCDTYCTAYMYECIVSCVFSFLSA